MSSTGFGWCPPYIPGPLGSPDLNPPCPAPPLLAFEVFLSFKTYVCHPAWTLLLFLGQREGGQGAGLDAPPFVRSFIH